MKNALNNQVGMLGDMFLWLVANLKQGVIYFMKQALPQTFQPGVYVVMGKNLGNIDANVCKILGGWGQKYGNDIGDVIYGSTLYSISAIKTTQQIQLVHFVLFQKNCS